MTTIPRSRPPQVGSAESRVVTCVIAKTKTRSKKSSSGVTRSMRPEASTAKTLPNDEHVARRAPHQACAHGSVDQAAQPASATDDDHARAAFLGGRANLARRIADGRSRRHADVSLAEEGARLVQRLT